MWAGSGVSGTGPLPSRSEKRKTNSGSKNSSRASKSDLGKPSSRSLREDSGLPLGQSEKFAAKSLGYSGSRASQNSASEVDEAPSIPSNLPHDASLILNQFPDQTPLDYSIPSIRPDTTSSGFGLAADYYNDQGESVQRQPGVRPNTPIITGTEPHLMAALTEPNPPQETGHGAAAEFYSNNDMAASETSYQTAPMLNSSSITAGAGATGATASMEASGLSNASRPTISQRLSSKSRKTGTSIPFLAAGAAAGAAGLGAAAYAQHTRHKSTSQHGTKFGTSSSGGRRSPSRQSITGSQRERQRTLPYVAETTRSYPGELREQRGPVRKFVDWWNNHEDVCKMEEYTEYIGVCRYCFDPQSNPRDGPRKHRPHKRASREFFRDRGRVDKGNRYGRVSSASSSDTEGGKSGIMAAAGLYGLGVAAATRGKQRKEFYNSDIDTKRLDFQDPAEAGANRVTYDQRSSQSPDMIGSDDRLISRRSQVDEQGVRGTKLGGEAMAVARRSSTSLGRRSSAARHTRHRKGSSFSSATESSSSDGDANLGFFGKIFSPRSRKRAKTMRKQSSGIYQNNSAASSFVNGLAYGREDSHVRRTKTSREPTARDASNAILGLGAAAAILASTDSKRKSGPGRIPELIAVREPKKKLSKPSLTRDSLSQLQTQSDNEWEDASDSNGSSSVDTGLAFGDFHYSRDGLARRSSASINSTGSATDKWNWRWARKAKTQRRASSPADLRRDSGSILPNIGTSHSAVVDSTDGSHGHRADYSADYGIQGPLRYIDPRPISDLNSPVTSDVTPVIPWDSDSNFPLRHPQPVPAVAQTVYGNEGQYDTSIVRSTDRPAHASEGSLPRLSRIEPLTESLGDSPLYDGYTLPRQRTGPLSSGRSGESPVGSRRIDSPRTAAHSESQSSIRDAAITGVMSAAAAGAVATMGRNVRRGSRQRSQGVRFATEEPGEEGRAADDGRGVRETPLSDISEQRMDLQAPGSRTNAAGIAETHQNILSVAQRPAYDIDIQEKGTVLNGMEGDSFQSPFPQLQAIDTLSATPGAFADGFVKNDDLVRVQSEPQFEIRHQGQIRTDHEPILDDEIFDPNFFKRSRAASEPQSESRQRSASVVVADLENRYTTKSPSMAEFFAPPELVFPTSAFERHVEVELDPESPVDIMDQATVTRDASDFGSTNSHEGRVTVSIPRLNVIAPTPPSSYAGSAKDPLSRSTSPAAAADAEKPATDGRITAKGPSASQPGWAGEQLPERESVQTREIEPTSTDSTLETTQWDTMSGALTADDTETATVGAIGEDESNADSSHAQGVISSYVSEIYTKKQMPDRFPQQKDVVSSRSRSPPEASQAGANNEMILGGSRSFRDEAHSLETDNCASLNALEQQPIDYENATQENISAGATHGERNDVPPVAAKAEQPKSGKKSKKSKSRQSKPLTSSWVGDADNDPGRRSRVPEEKVNMSFPGMQNVPKCIVVDMFQAASLAREMGTDAETASTLQGNSSHQAPVGLSTDISTDSLVVLEQGFQKASTENSQLDSSEVYTFPESYRDVPEMIRLPDSPPDSPRGFDDPGSTRKFWESIRSPTSPNLGRTPSSTAVPLPFYRRTPQSPWSNRESPVTSSSANEQSPTSAVRTRTSRPSSMDFKSNEFRPLYLLERNRKTNQLDPEEDLPPLPPSHSTSSASSVLDSDETFESALESLEHSPVQPDRSLDHGDPFDRDIPNVEYLDSQQATPKAVALLEDISDVPSQPLDDSPSLEPELKERIMQQPVSTSDTTVIGTEGGSSLRNDSDGQFSSSAVQEKAHALQSDPTLDVSTSASGASEDRFAPATQGPNGDEEETSWTIQPSRSKKGKKPKKGKKGRPAPIESSSSVSKPQPTTAAPEFPVTDGTGNEDSESTITRVELPSTKNLVTEPPLTARLAKFGENHRTGDTPTFTEHNWATGDEASSVKSDVVKEQIVPDAAYGSDNERSAREIDALVAKGLETADYGHQDVTHPTRTLLPDTSARDVDEKTFTNEGLGIYSISHGTIAEAKVRTSEDKPVETQTPPVSEGFHLPQDLYSDNLEQTAIDRSVQDRGQLNPADFALLDSLVNKRKPESEEQGGARDAENTASSLDNAPHAMNDTVGEQESKTVHGLLHPESAESIEKALVGPISPIAEQQRSVEDEGEPFQNFSWVPKSKKKKDKKAKKNEQILTLQDQDLETDSQRLTEPLKSGNETREVSTIAFEADWELPSRSQTKKGKKAKPVVPLVAVPGALNINAALTGPDNHVDEYASPGNESLPDPKSQAATLGGSEAVSTQELRQSRLEEQSIEDKTIRGKPDNPTNNEPGSSKVTEITRNTEESRETQILAVGDGRLDEKAFAPIDESSDTHPTVSGERKVTSIANPTEAVADDEWSVPAKNKKKKDKNKKKKTLPDEISDDFDDISALASLPAEDESVRSVNATETNIRSEVSVPSESGTKRDKKKLRFSLDPDVQISDGLTSDHATSAEPQSGGTFPGEDTTLLAQSSSNCQSAVTMQHRPPMSVVPGAFPEEAEDFLETDNAQSDYVSGADKDTIEFLDRLRNEENQSPIPKTGSPSAPEGGTISISMTPSIGYGDNLREKIGPEQEQGAGGESEASNYGLSLRPETRRILTSDFLEQLREEENQSPTPFATTASYAEGEPGEEIQPPLEQENGDNQQISVTDLLDPLLAEEESAAQEAEDARAPTTKSKKKKNKKNKRRNVIEPVQITEGPRDEDSEMEENSFASYSSGLVPDKTAQDSTNFSIAQGSRGDEFALPEQDDSKVVQELLEPNRTDAVAAGTEKHPTTVRETESLKANEIKRDEEDNKTYMSSSEIAAQKNGSQSDPTLIDKDRTAKTLDIDGFMEQEDAMEEALADHGALSTPSELNKEETNLLAKPTDADISLDIEPTIGAERDLAGDSKDIQHLNIDAPVAIENDQVDHDHQQPDPEAQEVSNEGSAMEEDRMATEQDIFMADDDDIPSRATNTQKALDTMGTKAKAFSSNERAPEEDSIKYAVSGGKTDDSIAEVDDTSVSRLPSVTLEKEPPVEEYRLDVSSKKSKKEKRKAKKAKRNQSMPIDEIQSREGDHEERSYSTVLLGESSFVPQPSRTASPTEYIQASHPAQVGANDERQNPLPVALSDVLALPILSPAMEERTQKYDGTSLRRSQSISELWHSNHTEKVEVQARSSSEIRRPMIDGVGFATAVSAGLQASGFDPSLALHNSRGNKLPMAPEPVTAMQKEESNKSLEGLSRGVSAREPTWSFNRLGEGQHHSAPAQDHEMARRIASLEDATFSHIVALGLDNAGFDKRAVQQGVLSDLTSGSRLTIEPRAAASDMELGDVTMRAHSPKSPADQWPNSSRRGSPQEKDRNLSKETQGRDSARSHSPARENSKTTSLNREISRQPLMSASRLNQQGVRDSGYHETMLATPESRKSEYATPFTHQASPVETTIKERTSSLFRPQSASTANDGYDSGIISERSGPEEQTSTTETISYVEDFMKKPGRGNLQPTVEEEEDSSHVTYPFAGLSSGTRPVSSTTHYRSQSRELDTIVEDGGERTAVDLQSQQSPHEYNFPATVLEIANSRRPYSRSPISSSPTPELVCPPSALSVRSRTPGSVASNRSGSPTLRRSNPSSDLGAEYKRGEAQAPGYPANALTTGQAAESTTSERRPNYDPLKGLGRVSSRDMSDTGVYAGWGDARESPRSPTEPPSVRKRPSLQIIDLENRLDQVIAENRSLQEGRGIDSSDRTRERSRGMESSLRDEELRQKDVEINTIRGSLETLQQEISRLTAHNEQLIEANRNLSEDANERYATVQAEHDDVHRQWQQTSRHLEQERDQHNALRTGMEAAVGKEISSALAAKNAEVQSLRNELAAAAEQIRVLQSQIQASSLRDIPGISGIPEEFLKVRNDDYIDSACHQLCSHVQQWILRFSKFSDMRHCRLSPDIHNEAIEGRLDNVVLDGGDVDAYLSDRIKRRDVFMSLTLTMIWEYIFTRYLFGMERTQRQTLKNLEKTLSEVGPRKAVAQWRATTLTLLSQRESFRKQRETDTDAVVQEIFSTLSTLLPPPQNLVSQIVSSLRNVVRLAVDLSIEMRTQRPEYVMLPPLHPEYDTNGDLMRKVFFNAGLMNERSGNFTDNGALEVEERSVSIVLFPLVVRRGDEFGEGSEEVVVAPAQVLVSRTEAEERRSAGAVKGNGANSSAKSVRGLGAENNRSQMSIAPSATGSGMDAGSFV